MSETTSTIVYLIIAVSEIGIVLWKGAALRSDPTPTLKVTVSTFVCSATVYVLAAPAVYRALGTALGQPSFATLPVYVGILCCFAHTHGLTLLWDPHLRERPNALRRSLISWTALYALAAIVMATLFCTADLSGPADPLRFNTLYAHDPLVLAFVLVFLATLACSTLSTYRRCRQIRLDDPVLQHAVNWFARAMLCVFGYVLCATPAITAASLGSHALDQVGVFGSTCGATGALLAGYGLSGAAISAWWRERRDRRLLQPLWDLVVAGVDKDLAISDHSVTGRPLWNAGFLLHRGVVEILDGLRILGPWTSPQLVQSVYALHQQQLTAPQPATPLSPKELETIATAAAIRDALPRLQAARKAPTTAQSRPPAGGSAASLPGADTPMWQERERLLAVAGALTHPLTAAALAHTHGKESTGSVSDR
ncbi:DUF6545 domain-containing protein [Streptomyces sp. NPDC059994]|uniref:DUF6545 domain-containing protein n=1 Tax=Streptomyces sp. NPDC059994 TaxID=3347029 RepID=UPI00367A2A86